MTNPHATLHKTRHFEATSIAFRCILPGHWQHVDLNDPARPAQVGPAYKTKAELLADHESYLSRAGWMGSL